MQEYFLPTASTPFRILATYKPLLLAPVLCFAITLAGNACGSAQWRGGGVVWGGQRHGS